MEKSNLLTLFFRTKMIRVLSIFVAIVYSMSHFFWTNLDDPYFWFNKVEFFTQDFFNFFSLFIGKIWKVVTFNNILLFKLLGWLCGIISILSVYFILITREARNKYFYLLVISIFCLKGTQGMFAPDSMTILSIVFFMIYLIKNKSNYGTRDIVICSLFTAIIIGMRFPNIVIIHLLAVYIFVKYYLWQKKIKEPLINSIIYVLISLMLYYISVVLICREFDIIGFAEQAFSSNTEAHSLGYLILCYIWASKEIIYSILSTIGVLAIWLFFYNEKYKVIINLFFSLILLIVLEYYGDIYGIYSFLLIFLCIYIIKKADVSINDKTLYLLIICMGFINAAGSNTGFLKINPFFAAFAPYILIKYLQYSNLKYKSILFYSLITITLTSIYSSGTKIKEYFKTGNIEVRNITDFKNLFINRHEFIFMTDHQYSDIKYNIEIFNQYGKMNKTVFYGRPENHIMYAITGTKELFNTPFYQEPDDFLGINKVMKLVQEDNELVLFDYSKSDLIKEEMSNYKYNRVEESNVNIYKK